jgi:hypothetical protein
LACALVLTDNVNLASFHLVQITPSSLQPPPPKQQQSPKRSPTPHFSANSTTSYHTTTLLSNSYPLYFFHYHIDTSSSPIDSTSKSGTPPCTEQLILAHIRLGLANNWIFGISRDPVSELLTAPVHPIPSSVPRLPWDRIPWIVSNPLRPAPNLHTRLPTPSPSNGRLRRWPASRLRCRHQQSSSEQKAEDNSADRPGVRQMQGTSKSGYTFPSLALFDPRETKLGELIA